MQLTFYREGNTTPVTATATVPAHCRSTIDLNAVPGLANAAFATELVVTNGVPIVVERTMYWPANGSGWNAMHLSRARPW